MPEISIYLKIKLGMIKVNKRSCLEHRFWAKVDKDGPIHPIHGQCWNWLSITYPDGYCGISIKNVGHKAHRVAYELLIGPIPNGLLACHKCDNRSCVNPFHIFLGTYQDNQTDCVNKGRSPKGVKNSKAKLSEEDVLQIRHRCKFYDPVNSMSALAREFGITKEMVANIIHRENWTHI